MSRKKKPNAAHLRKHRVGERFGWQCHYCHRAVVCHVCKPQPQATPSTASLDHVVPKASDGPGTLSNLVLACVECNERKGSLRVSEGASRLDIEWMACEVDAIMDEYRRNMELKRLISELGWVTI